MAKRIMTDVCMEFAGSQYSIDTIKAVIKVKVAEEMPKVDVKKIGIYLQPETGFIYYTVNSKGSPEQFISFDDVEEVMKAEK